MKALLVIALALAIVACDGKSKSATPNPIVEGPAKAMEKAKGVEGTLEQGSQQRREEIDNQSK